MIYSTSPRPLLRVVLVALTLAFFTACSKDPAAEAVIQAGERSNVLVVMLDDLGYSDIGAYGGEIQTPNMDRLAAGGIRFTEFYNHSRCSPTRASLLTGVYAHRVGLGKNGSDMNRKVATVAETLRENGYQTAMVGKWHLTRAQPLADRDEHLKWLSHRAYPDKDFGNPETYPVGRGFERHYGPIWGVVNFFDPFSLVDGTEPVREVPDDYYITDALSDKAVEYIDEMSGRGQPFFLYLAHTAPHWPVHALPEDIAKYDGVYDDGWHTLRKKRYQRLIELGLIDPEVTPLPAHDGSGASTAGDWASLSEDEKNYQSAKMMAHAAMIDRVDQGLGNILDTLERNGELNNTLVLVLADNGASPEVPGLPGYDRPGHMRDGTPISTGDRDMSVVPGGEDSFTGIGGWWANAANTPWRYWKKQSYDGGVHTPAIAYWPAGITADAGSLADGLHHVADIAPTIYELAGVEAPANLDGRSLLPAFAGKDVDRGEPLFFEHEGGRAVIDGQWKLVSFAPAFRQKTMFREWVLYDLSGDRSETNDVAAVYPETVERLAATWYAWAEDVGVEMRQEPDSPESVSASPEG